MSQRFVKTTEAEAEKWLERSLETGIFEVPRPGRPGEATIAMSEVAFEALFAALPTRAVH